MQELQSGAVRDQGAIADIPFVEECRGVGMEIERGFPGNSGPLRWISLRPVALGRESRGGLEPSSPMQDSLDSKSLLS